MFESIVQDIRHALRQFARSPGFSAAAILTFGLGIGATTAVFSVVSAVLLRPFPGIDSFDRVVSIYTSDFSGPPYGSSSLPDLRDFADGVPALSGVGGHAIRPTVFNDGEGSVAAEMVLSQVVTPNFFDLLGAGAEIGRTFAPGEGTPEGRSDVVVLGGHFWRTRFAGDPDVVGSTVRLAGQPYTVIGVAEEGFRGLLPAVTPAFFVPTGAPGIASPGEERRGSRGFFAFGRLADGATLEQARTQLGALATGLHETYPDAWTDVRGARRAVSVLPARETMVPPQIRGPSIGFAALLMAIAAGVLLIASANIANLLLVRATARRREMGIRLAIGAGRRRVARQLLTESLLLASLGAAVGVAIANLATDALASFATRLPLPFSVRLEIGPDVRVLAFAATVTILAGIVSGLAPALLSTRLSLSASVRREEPGGRRLGLKGFLSSAQIAVATVLLVCGGLLVRSVLAAHAADPGFRTEGLHSVSVAHDEQATTPAERLTFQTELLERVRGLPGVTDATYVSALPLSAGGGRRDFRPVGYSPGPAEDMELYWADAAPNYFRVVGTPLLAGREFDGTDRAGGPLVAVVNESFVQRYLQGGEALGARILSGGDTLTIVGVAQNGSYVALGEEPQPYVWRSADQFPPAMGAVVARAAPGGATGLTQAIREVVAGVDPDVAITGAAEAGEHLSLVLLPQRTGAWLLGILGATGLGLAVIGIYGVMAYAVSQRRREFGIRLALGARPESLTRMVLRQGMTVAGVGAVVGLALALGISQVLGFLLFGIEPFDLATFGAVSTLVLGAALLANWLPARGPARADPVETMRIE